MSRIANLSELASVLCNNKKTGEGVLHFHKTFKPGRFLKAFFDLKSKGIDVSDLLPYLLFFRLWGESINEMQERMRNFFERIDDNTFYRLMNNPRMDWRKLLLGLAKEFKAHVRARGDSISEITCFVLDDNDIKKTGKTFEFISRVFNHVTKLFHLGFKMLALGYCNGKSLIALNFSLHREKGQKGNYGLSKKEIALQFSNKRDSQFPGYKRITELDKKKEVAVSMLERAVRNGFMATYVLMDSWFVNDYMIKSIRSTKKGGMHILGMCKLDRRKYLVDKKGLNARQLITKYERKRGKYSRKYKSTYISLVVDYKGEKVKLFLIRYHRSKNRNVLLTTNLAFFFTTAIELYQIRWTIEVLFKECKQYLHLGCGQNTDFDGQIADATLALATHTILTLQKRFSAYGTMDEPFRETRQQLPGLTLWKRLIKIFIKMPVKLTMVMNIDREETIESLLYKTIGPADSSWPCLKR